MELYTPLISFNWTLVMNWVTVLVLYLILKRFFFEKVRNFMLQRQEGIQKQLEDAENTSIEAKNLLTDYKTQIANVEAEGRAIVTEAKQRADMQAQKILDEANIKASEMMVKATADIEREKAKAVSEMKQYIADLALIAAEQILEKQIDAKGQDEIIDRIIEQEGKAQWQN